MIAEGQLFGGASKRTARSVYQLGTEGYKGTEQDVLNYTTATYDNNPKAHIDFIGMHHALAGAFSSASAEATATMVGTKDLPRQIEPVSSGAGSPNLSLHMNKAVECLLNEMDFNVPLAVAYLSLNRFLRRAEYLTPDGSKISANAILRDMNNTEARHFITSLNDTNKLYYMGSIIAGFADGEQEIYGKPIQEFIAPYMPPYASEARCKVEAPTTPVPRDFPELP